MEERVPEIFATDTMRDKLELVQELADDLWRATRELVRTHPYGALVAGAAAGLVVGRLTAGGERHG